MIKETEILQKVWSKLYDEKCFEVADFLSNFFNWNEQKSLKLFKRALKIYLVNKDAEVIFNWFIPRQQVREAFLILHEKELEKMN